MGKHADFLGRHMEVISPTEKLSGLALDIDHVVASLHKLEDRIVKRVLVGDV